MRDYKLEFEKRVKFIKDILKESGADGIIFGNSGGKDSALVGILCKAACDNTLGVIMPCGIKRNFTEDFDDGIVLANRFSIETRVVDISSIKDAVIQKLFNITKLNKNALINMAPRIRMITLYSIAASENRLVAGTGNASEYFVGYFTKWGDGAHDFNPIADLTASEVFEFLEYLKAPENIIKKAPSAALFDGQTDEHEMGVTYKELDAYIRGEEISEISKEKIDKLHNTSNHKRTGIKRYGE